MPSLSIDFCGMHLRNPTVLASGILGVAGSTLKRVAERGGAGAVITKSISMEPRSGHANPSVLPLEGGMLNSIGLSNPGCKNFKDEIAIAKQGGAPVIGSAFGFAVEEFAEVARTLESYGVDALELNLSCPNVELGSQYALDPELCSKLIRRVKENADVPIIAKLSAEAKDILEVAKACASAGCDGITAINTIRAMKIDIKTHTPILSNKTGGLSGGAIKPIAVRCVYEIASELDIPIMGCGGITTGEDAVEFIMAGATAVQMGTAVYSRGISVFQKVAEEMEAFMKEAGYAKVEDMIGIAL